MVADLIIGPGDPIGVDGPPLSRYLRRIDNQRLVVSVLDDEVSIQDLYDATQDVRQRVAGWLKRTPVNMRG